MRDLDKLHAQADHTERHHAKARLKLPAPLHRVDLGLGSAIALVAAGGLIGGVVFAGWLASTTAFDPPLFAEVEDPRILSDYRQSDSPLVDMVRAKDELLLGRGDGSIEVYDTRLATFSREALPRDFQSALSLLAVDCADQACVDPRSYALTQDGGLARREGDEWVKILGDDAFVGAKGTRVQQADIRAWAASASGRAVLLDARDQGLGLFNQVSGSWRAGPPITGANSGPVALGETFVIGSSSGLHLIGPGPRKDIWGATPLEGSEGEILSLAATAAGKVLALRRGACTTAGSGCLSLLELDAAGRVVMLWSETESHPELNDAALLHVAMQDGHLVGLSAEGLYRYDTDQRRWEILVQGAISAHFATTDGTTLYAALPDRLVELRKAEIVKSLVLPEPLRQVLPLQSGAVYGLDRRGRILDLSGNTATVISHDDAGVPADAQFTSVTTVSRGAGDMLLLAIGPQGLLVHGLDSRRYAFISRQALPELNLVQAQLIAGRRAGLWLVSGRTGAIASLELDGDFPAVTVQANTVANLGSGLRAVGAEADSLSVILSDGAAMRIALDGSQSAVIGSGLSRNFTPQSAAQTGEHLFFADAKQIFNYDNALRSWTGPLDAPSVEPIKDIAVSSEHFVSLDAAGALWLLGDDGWQAVSAAPVPAVFGSGDLQDAMSKDGDIYLAANGTVQRYTPAARSFNAQWNRPGRAARLLGITGSAPIWTNSAGLHLGDSTMQVAGDYLNGFLAADGPVALARNGAGQPYLASAQLCLFNGIAAPTGEIRHVAQLAEDQLLVVTAQQAAIYQPKLHRWLAVKLPTLSADSRLLVLGAHLVMLAPDRLASVPLSDILQPASCDTAAADITWSLERSALQASRVDGSDSILLLSDDTSLQLWQDGALSQLRSSAGQAPQMSDVISARALDGRIEMATASGLFTYQIDAGLWSQRPFAGPSTALATIDMTGSGQTLAIAAWDQDGLLWANGDVKGQSPITLTRQQRPDQPMLPGDPAELRDMARANGKVYLLTDSKLLVYAPSKALPDLHIHLPPARAPRQLAVAEGELFLLEGDPAQPLAVYHINQDEKGQKALAEVSASYLRGRDRAWQLTQGPKVQSITADLQARECDLAIGSSTCRIVAGAPLKLEPTDVLAFDQTSSILLTRDTALRLDGDLRPQTRYDAITPRAGTRLFRLAHETYVWRGRGDALWLVQNDQTVQLARKIDALRDLDGVLMAVEDGAVRRISGSKLIEPPQSLRTARLAVALRGGWSGIDDNGQAFGADGAVTADPVIQFVPDLRFVAPIMASGKAGDKDISWLSLDRKNALRLQRAQLCLPAVDPAFIGPLLPAIATPCEESLDLTLQLAADESILDLKALSPTTALLRSERRDVEFDLATGKVISDTPAPDGLADANDSLTAQFSHVDGISYLNPPTLGPSGIAGLRHAGALTVSLSQPDAFDAGWVAWDRQSRGIRFANGPALPPVQAYAGGRLLPLSEGRGLLSTDGSTLWATLAGLWRQSGTKMTQVTTQSPAGLPDTIDAGQFVWANGQGIAQDGSQTQGPHARVEHSMGLELRFEPRSRALGVTLSATGANDLGPQGFLHDQRLSAVSLAGSLHIATPVGLIVDGDLSAPQALPAGLQRLEGEHGKLFALNANLWSVANGGLWQPADAPFQTARLASENGRLWDLDKGSISVTSTDPWRIAGTGLAFDVDRLEGFAANSTSVVAITKAGSLSGQRLADLAGLRQADTKPAALPLSDWRLSPTQNAIFDADSNIWDASQKAWRRPAASEQPWASRLAVDAEDITIAFAPAAKASITAEDFSGASRQLPFIWGADEPMPFDRARQIHADPQGSGLLMGTSLGLRALSPSPAGLSHGRLRTAQGKPEVIALGRPDAAPDQIEVQFGDGSCFAMAQVGANPSVCTTAHDLRARRVMEAPLLQLSEGGGQVDLHYIVDDKPLRQAWPISARLDKDRLRERMLCDGQTVELWEDPAVVRIDARQYRLDGLHALHCQTSPSRLAAGGALPEGLYALTAAAALHFDGTSFTPATPAQSDAVGDWASRAIVAESGNLRYGLARQQLDSALYDLSGAWTPTPWQAGKLALDQPMGLAADKGLQSLTTAGLIPSPNGRADPATVIAMQGASTEDIARCAPVKIDRLDGFSHGLAAVTGHPLRLYCQDGNWLEGDTSGKRDAGAFVPVQGQAMQRILIDSAPWHVTQSLSSKAETESVAFAVHGEAARLGAGRFDFDDLRAVSAPFNGVIEQLSASGWWRSPADDLGLDALQRAQTPIAPRDVVGLSRNWSLSTGEMGLCIELGATRYFWDGTGALQAAALCDDARGQDAIWRWSDSTQGPRADAVSLNGAPLRRSLVDGRFSDLVLSGPPLETASGEVFAPAGLGILHWTAIHTPPDGIYATSAQGVLARDKQGGPVWIDRQGTLALAGEGKPVEDQALDCAALPALARLLPEGEQLLRIAAPVRGHLEALSGTQTARRQLMVDCGDPAASQPWQLRQDLSAHPRSLALGARKAGVVTVAMQEGQTLLQTDDRYATGDGLPLKDLRGLVSGQDDDTGFAMDAQRLYRLSLGAGLSGLRKAVAPASRPAPAPASAPPQTVAAASPDKPPPARPTAQSPAKAAQAARNRDQPLPSAKDASAEKAYATRDIQKALVRVTGEAMMADGKIGSRSRRMIATWQRQIGSEPTGYLSEAQLILLLKVTS